MVEVQFMALTGPPKRVKTERFTNTKEAIKAVQAYAEPHGFSNIKLVDGDDPYDGFRITGKTPGGRNGRNIAYGDWCDGEGELPCE